MLIYVPEHTIDDLRMWEYYEKIDSINARRWRFRLEKMAGQAMSDMESFASDGACWAATSWGKDSTVLAHLVWRLGQERRIHVPVFWARLDPVHNPYCPRVRDDFLSRFHVDYYEGAAPCTLEEASGMDEVELDAAYDRATAAATGHPYWKTRRISGIRSQESGVRALRMYTHGVSSRMGCAPIGWWKTDHIFAYLHAHDLPVHPSYAMTQGGLYLRDHLRVACLGGERGRGVGRGEWEERYYGWRIREIQTAA